MRHRETIRRKLEQIDSNMANMDLLVKRGGNVDSFLELISRTEMNFSHILDRNNPTEKTWPVVDLNTVSTVAPSWFR